MTTNFESILIANRGEIAVRVIRTAKSLGYRSIAVYSDADADAPHVKLADEAVLIGPAPVADSYLDPERILAAAKHSGADAIHPGYGFLSENAPFALACEQAGITFIGPGADAIVAMGNKAEAKRRMNDAGVPCVPGYEGEEQTNKAFTDAAEEIGYPIMVKAAAGGGGRGMRLVEKAAGLVDALELARSESLNAFGSDELILEKAIVRPRHVEVQVFADNHGNVIHLGERDCSVQRRHQKIIEEAPCPTITDELRSIMGAAAIEAAKSIDYRGAGTVEFLLDQEDRFYFLEMNTRLQVEHPVTEMITGLDLVEWQINVARGESLPLKQNDVRLKGHAIEVRLYAEDPDNNFMPSTGTIRRWQAPSGIAIRVDAGIESGLTVSPWYDPMLAKIVAHGDTRDEALSRLIDGLGDTALFGPTTNRDFLIRVLSNTAFAEGKATTAFIEEELDTDQAADDHSDASMLAIAAILAFRKSSVDAFAASVRVAPELCNWNSTGPLASRLELDSDGASNAMRVSPVSSDEYNVSNMSIRVVDSNEATALLEVDGTAHKVHTHLPDANHIYIATGRRTALFTRTASNSDTDESAATGHVVAPMHGQLLELCVDEGDMVEKGARLAVLEAMKMQHEIRARVGGIVKALHYQTGDQIAADTLILEIEEMN